MGASIIINADDIGRSVPVNEAFFRLVEQGRVTSGSLVATGDAFEDAVRRAKAHPQCSYGVHLFLDEFQPATDLAAFPALLSRDGRFQANARRYPYGAEVREALTQEWAAQIERVQQSGIQVSHLDSHQHIHTFPPVFRILKRVQALTGIRKVRCTLNCYAEPKPLRLLGKWLYNTALRHFPPTVTTDYFMPFGIFHALLQARHLPGMGAYELMVHPGASTYPEEPGSYEEELALLAGDWEQGLPWSFRFITYNDL